ANDRVAFLDARAVLRIDEGDAAGDGGDEGHLGEVGLELGDAGGALAGGGACDGDGGGGLGDGLARGGEVGRRGDAGGFAVLLAREDDVGAALVDLGLDDGGLGGAQLSARGV